MALRRAMLLLRFTPPCHAVDVDIMALKACHAYERRASATSYADAMMLMMLPPATRHAAFRHAAAMIRATCCRYARYYAAMVLMRAVDEAC